MTNEYQSQGQYLTLNITIEPDQNRGLCEKYTDHRQHDMNNTIIFSFNYVEVVSQQTRDIEPMLG